MKKITAMFAVLAILICSLSACSQDGFEEGYSDGYGEGYSEGYYAGIAKAQRYLDFVVDDDLSSLANDIENEYGIHPEDALTILSNYADVPDAVDESQLNNAIWAIYSYYHASNEVINGIEDYWID